MRLGITGRKGSVYLVVLLVMVGSLSLVSSLQQVLLRRSRILAQQQTEAQLRTALLLGMQQAGQMLLEDDDLSVDTLQDPWMEPREFVSSDGVQLRIQIQDAQTRLNLNHLRLPGLSFRWSGVLESLMQEAGFEPDPEWFRRLDAQLEEEEVWFENTDLLSLILPEAGDFVGGTDLLTALPHPDSRPLPLNLNTVRPEVLAAVLAPSLQGWTQTILETRDQSPIRSVDSLINTLPPPVQTALREVFSVRSDWMEARLLAQKEETVRSLRVLFRRSAGNVEVMRCQW
ncbi:MAG: general secretion pathway protein GspK [Kiritimatiellia bacterium]